MFLRRIPWPALVGLGLVLVVAGGRWAYRAWPKEPAATLVPPSVTRIADEQALPEFVLQRQGGTFGNAQLLGHWSLVFFGYTSCPDFCPTALAALKEVKARLQGQGLPAVQTVMVSVDAARDTPQIVQAYAGAFDADFIGAVGSDEALQPLAKHLGVFYQRNDQVDKRNYAVDHSTAIYLIDPKGRLNSVFSGPHDAGQMAADLTAAIR